MLKGSMNYLNMLQRIESQTDPWRTEQDKLATPLPTPKANML